MDFMILSRAELGIRLKKLRKSKSWSQTKLSEQLQLNGINDCTYQSVSNWERGKNYPHTSTLQAYCRIFNVSMDYLSGMDDGNDAYDSITLEEIKEDGRQALIAYVSSFSNRNIMIHRSLLDSKYTLWFPECIPEDKSLRITDSELSMLADQVERSVIHTIATFAECMSSIQTANKI